MSGNRGIGLVFALAGAVLVAWTWHLVSSAPGGSLDAWHTIADTLGFGLGFVLMTTGVSLFTNPGHG